MINNYVTPPNRGRHNVFGSVVGVIVGVGVVICVIPCECDNF